MRKSCGCYYGECFCPISKVDYYKDIKSLLDYLEREKEGEIEYLKQENKKLSARNKLLESEFLEELDKKLKQRLKEEEKRLISEREKYKRLTISKKDKIEALKKAKVTKRDFLMCMSVYFEVDDEDMDSVVDALEDEMEKQ